MPLHVTISLFSVLAQWLMFDEVGKVAECCTALGMMQSLLPTIHVYVDTQICWYCFCLGLRVNDKNALLQKTIVLHSVEVTYIPLLA